ncbi:MAG: hypothetical protein IJQ81_03745 [Oscillibacter sp.]|nr:hypothetical protein [Oscillibacter sp.]
MYYRQKGPNVLLIVVALIVIIVATVFQNYQKSVSAQETAVKSWESAEDSAPSTSATFSYALNTNTMKIHKPSCSSVFEMADHNRQWTNKSIEELEREGYTKCQRCF